MSLLRHHVAVAQAANASEMASTGIAPTQQLRANEEHNGWLGLQHEVRSMRIKRIAVSLKNVGLPTFLGMQYCKALPRSRAPYTLTSKMLDYPVQARPRTSDVRAFSQIFAENEYRCL